MRGETTVRSKRSTAPWLPSLALLLLPGCWVEQRYVMNSEQASALTLATAPVLEAQRENNHRPAKVLANRIVAGSVKTDPAGGASFTTRAYSPMVTTGAVLTFFGTGISIVGAGLFWGTHGTSRTVGAVLAGSGEAPMISGSVLWVYGLNHPPQEHVPKP